MPPKPLVDLSQINLETVEADIEDIRRYNAQRYEFEQLNGILHYDEEAQAVVGYKDVSEEEFWVRGHIPGRPLLPGVLMCEAAAQLCSYYYKRATQTEKFVGFGGLDEVKFRGQVVPGERLILIASVDKMGRRRAIFQTQGLVAGKVVFQAVVTGMPM